MSAERSKTAPSSGVEAIKKGKPCTWKVSSRGFNSFAEYPLWNFNTSLLISAFWFNELVNG